MACIFLGEPVLVKVIGGVITVFLLLQSFLLWQRYHKAAREVYNLVGSRSPQDKPWALDRRGALIRCGRSQFRWWSGDTRPHGIALLEPL